jgi:hypothetical protein
VCVCKSAVSEVERCMLCCWFESCGVKRGLDVAVRCCWCVRSCMGL